MRSLTYIAPEPAMFARLRRLPPVAAFRPEDLAALEREARPAVGGTGAGLPATGSGGRVVHAILDGSVAVLREAAGGQHCLVDVCDAPCLFGELALFDDRALALTAEVLQPVLVIEVPAAALLRGLRDNAAAQLRLLAYMSGRLRRLIVQIANLKLMTGPQRLAQFLTVLSERRAGPEAWAAGTVQLPFEKRTLAALLGMTPESLSRAFKRLDALGVHTLPGGTVRVPDIAALRQFVEPEVVD